MGRKYNLQLIFPELVSAVNIKLLYVQLEPQIDTDWPTGYKAFHNLKSFLNCKMFSCPVWGLK